MKQNYETIVSVSERYLTSDYMKIEQANYWRQYEIGIQDIPQNNILQHIYVGVICGFYKAKLF